MKSTLDCFAFLISPNNDFALIWISQLPKIFVFNSNWGIPFLSEKLVLFILNMIRGFMFLYLCFRFSIYFRLYPSTSAFWRELHHLSSKQLSPKPNCRLVMRHFCGTSLHGLLPSLPVLFLPSLICFTAESAFYLWYKWSLFSSRK